MRAMWTVLALGLVGVAAWIVLAPGTAIAVAPTEHDALVDAMCVQPVEDGASQQLAEVAAEDLAKPSESACCNPDTEPGVGGPLCFEGHACCSDGNWRCNNADGSPSCSPGEVCEEGCGERNDPCSSDDDCCSGTCKPNGHCK